VSESPDVVVLAAYLLWGDYTRFLRDVAMPLTGRGCGSDAGLIDLDAIEAFGTSLSTLSKSSAEALVRWLRGERTAA
jgi:hypothetical protein